MLVEELLVAVEAAAHAHVPRATRAGEANRLVNGDHRRGGEDAADAGAGAEPLHEEPAGGERDEAGDEQDEGGHAADDSRGTRPAARRVGSAGESVARRNLLDAWTLMSSPPLASLGPSGLRSTLRGRGRRRVNRAYPPIRGRGPDAAAQLSTGRPHAGDATGRPADGARCRGSAGAAPRQRVERPDLAGEARQHQLAADELGRGDDVASGRPARRPRRDGSSANVSISACRITWGRRDDPSDRHDRRGRAVAPAQLAGPGARTRSSGSRTSRAAGPRCPTGARPARR